MEEFKTQEAHGTQLRVSQKFARLNAPSDSLDSPSVFRKKKKAKADN